MPNQPHSQLIDENDLRYAILEGAPALLWLGDPEGNCVFLNHAQREFWGVAPDLAGFSWGATLHPDDIDKLAGPYQKAMRDRTPFEIEARYRRADGEWRILNTSARPRFSTTGEFLGMVGVNTDVTDQRNAEHSLRQTAEQLDFALDAAAEMGTWVLNASDNRLSGDRRFAAALDLPTVEVSHGIPFEVFLNLVAEEDRWTLKATFAKASDSGEIFRCQFRTGTGSGERWFSLVGRCERDELGHPRRLAGVMMDIRERKQREMQLELLTRELTHRIKNIFAVAGSMARLTAREHPAAADAIQALQGRFTAMAAAYAQVAPAITKSRGAGNLRELIHRIFAPYLLGDAAAVAVVAPDISLNETAAASVALILHELATNSAKYGALSEGRQVQFTVRSEPGEKVKMVWIETGGHAEIEQPGSQGFGSKLIQMSAAAIDGQVTNDWRREGLLWQMSVPLHRIQ
ncbi:MAG: PAS domain-containing protein [bacterium]